MKITYQPVSTLPDGGDILVSVTERKELSVMAQQLDDQTGGAISRAMAVSPRFTGGKGQSLPILAPGSGQYGRILLIGLGQGEQVTDRTVEEAGGKVIELLQQMGVETLTIDAVPPPDVTLGGGVFAARMVQGMRLRSWRFDTYRSAESMRDGKVSKISELTVLTDDAGQAAESDTPLREIAEGVFLARQLVSDPPNILYPESFADRMEALVEIGLSVEILGPDDMKRLGMNALLGVAQGSVREPRIAILSWQGGRQGDAPIALIGKGVTFDSGGLSLKPPGGMEDMKWDMGGAGTVSGVMRALAGRKARANVIGLLGLTENMPSGSAQRPGDIVRSISGQTIEVLNTDAEGRLVLADVLWYAQNRFAPRLMIDLATLTGAMIIALGHEWAGLFSNDDVLAGRLLAVGELVGERLWRMPLDESFDRKMDSDAADMKNISGSRAGGSITAAQFLQRHVNQVTWAHLDIAGMVWSKKDAPLYGKGATGYGVRLLDRFIAEYHEDTQ